MADQLQLRGGTTNEHSTFTGALREVTVDTDKDTLIVHDAATAGGHPLLREDGSNSALSLGTAGTPSLKFTGDPNTGIYSPGADQVAVATNGTGRLFVDASGNVGVGVTPSELLHIRSGSDPTIRIDNTDSTSRQGYITLANTGDMEFRARSNTSDGQFIFYGYGGTVDSEKVRITSAGLVGIGTTSPNALLDVTNGGFQLTDTSSSFAASESISYYHDTSTQYAEIQFKPQNAGQGYIYFKNRVGSALTDVLTIQGSNVGIGTTSPGSKFEVHSGTDNAAAEFVSTDARVNIGFADSGSTLYSGLSGVRVGADGDNLALYTANSESARIDSSGKLLVGTTTAPSAVGPLQIVDTASPVLVLARNDTSIVEGNSVGQIRFLSNDSTAASYEECATIAAAADGSFADGDKPTRLVFSTTADGASSPTERLRIDSAGNVGIGTTAPAKTLEVNGTAAVKSANPYLYLTQSGTSGQSRIYFGDSDSEIRAYTVYDHSDDSYRLSTASIERLRIDSSGRLLVGTSSNESQFSSSLQVVRNTSTSVLVSRYSNDLTGPVLYFAKSRGASIGTKTVVQSGDETGKIDFRGTDGTNHLPTASITSHVDGTPGANDMPGRLVFSTTADGASTPTERMRITNAGFVGIGTASPSSQLHLQSSSPNLRLESTSATGASVIQFGDPNDIDVGSIRYEHTDNALRFIANAAERVRIDSSGRLLVGTSSSIANTKVESANTGGNNYGAYRFVNSGGGSDYWLFKSRGTTVGAHGLVSNGDTAGSIQFALSDGTNYIRCANISAGVDGTPGTNDMPGRLSFATTPDGANTPTERMRIDKDGFFSTFFGTNGITSRSAASAGTTYFLYRGMYNGTSTIAGGSVSYYVYTNGNVANINNSYGAISDIKLKENIVDANSQWDDLKALQVRNYNFKEGQTHTQIGLVAQEAELVSPGLVSESPDRDDEGNDLGTVTKSVNYSVLYMKAVKALQEAMERIETLEGMVAVNNITIDEQQHQLSTLAARLTALESA